MSQRRDPDDDPLLIEPEPPEMTIIDLVPDELALARGQLASGLATLAELGLRRRIARLEAGGRGNPEELDAARSLLAEALWRQGRPLAAGAALDGIRAASMERRRPITALIEAEALAAAGRPDQAAALAEQVVAALGVDEAWRLRAGVPSRIAWPLPAAFRAPERPAAQEASGDGSARPPGPEEAVTAHARLEAARVEYRAERNDEGDRQLGLALRLDPRLAPEGIALVEPTLGAEPPAERLLLYGDLLRAAGRATEAADAYSRAAQA